jgi:hypothetical protein
MKVVINSCFGGFSLSVEAIKKLTLLNAKCIKSITPLEYYGGNNPVYKKKRNWEEEWKKDLEEYYDIGDGFKAHKRDYNIYDERTNLLYDFEDVNKNRADENLIKVVKKLGKKSWGHCAELKIIEIPDNIDWGIDEYDGMESVEETHQSWS